MGDREFLVRDGCTLFELIKMPDMNLTDMKLEDRILYRLKITYIKHLQCNVQFFLKQRQNTSHNSKVICIICICIIR